MLIDSCLLCCRYGILTFIAHPPEDKRYLNSPESNAYVVDFEVNEQGYPYDNEYPVEGR